MRQPSGARWTDGSQGGEQACGGRKCKCHGRIRSVLKTGPDGTGWRRDRKMRRRLLYYAELPVTRHVATDLMRVYSPLARAVTPRCSVLSVKGAASLVWRAAVRLRRHRQVPLMTSPTLLPFQPDAMSPAQLAAVSYLARYSGQTHALYTYQLRRWFAWCETNAVDPLVGVQRAHVELYIRHLSDSGLVDSTVVTMMHGVRGFFRFAHIDGLIASDPAVYARLRPSSTKTRPGRRVSTGSS